MVERANDILDTILVILIVAAATLALTGCQTCAPISDRTICPQIASYSQAEMLALSAEMDRLPPGSALGQAMVDYRRLRDQIRACWALK